MSIGDDDIRRTPESQEANPKSCLVIGLIAGGLTGVTLLCGGCCLGTFYFRGNSVANDIASDLQGNPVVTEHIGEVESFEPEFHNFISSNDQYVFHVRGTLSSGTITAKCVVDGDGIFRAMGGKLELDDGDVYDLFPDGRDLESLPDADHNQFWSDTFSQEVIDRLVKDDIAGQEVIVEHIGSIQKLASDREKSLQEPGDIWIFQIRGDKGGGLLRANCVLVADNDMDVDSGVLMLDSGEIVQLFPDNPMDPVPDDPEPEPVPEAAP